MAKILLIDDDEDIYKLLSAFLEHAGHHVIWAQDGAYGISMCALEQPDMIILDVRMPVMDGPHTIDLLKAEPGMASTPVVALSADDDKNIRQKMLDEGCIAYLQKPIDLHDLERCITGVLTFRNKDRA